MKRRHSRMTEWVSSLFCLFGSQWKSETTSGERQRRRDYMSCASWMGDAVATSGRNFWQNSTSGEETLDFICHPSSPKLSRPPRDAEGRFDVWCHAASSCTTRLPYTWVHRNAVDRCWPTDWSTVSIECSEISTWWRNDDWRDGRDQVFFRNAMVQCLPLPFHILSISEPSCLVLCDAKSSAIFPVSIIQPLCSDEEG